MRSALPSQVDSIAIAATTGTSRPGTAPTALPTATASANARAITASSTARLG